MGDIAGLDVMAEERTSVPVINRSPNSRDEILSTLLPFVGLCIWFLSAALQFFDGPNSPLNHAFSR
jgi:hypothetical protein